jgi:hypothetical protein
MGAGARGAGSGTSLDAVGRATCANSAQRGIARLTTTPEATALERGEHVL